MNRKERLLSPNVTNFPSLRIINNLRKPDNSLNLSPPTEFVKVTLHHRCEQNSKIVSDQKNCTREDTRGTVPSTFAFSVFLGKK